MVSPEESPNRTQFDEIMEAQEIEYSAEQIAFDLQEAAQKFVEQNEVNFRQADMLMRVYVAPLKWLSAKIESGQIEEINDELSNHINQTGYKARIYTHGSTEAAVEDHEEFAKMLHLDPHDDEAIIMSSIEAITQVQSMMSVGQEAKTEEDAAFTKEMVMDCAEGFAKLVAFGNKTGDLFNTSELDYLKGNIRATGLIEYPAPEPISDGEMFL